MGDSPRQLDPEREPPGTPPRLRQARDESLQHSEKTQNHEPEKKKKGDIHQKQEYDE